MKPLDGIIVLDFGQFLSAPSAALRLADLGATVIKIEKTGVGDICRALYISNCQIDNDSSLFQAINRNKDGIALDLKDASSKNTLYKLIEKADVMLVNFRPGVTEKLGIDYNSVKNLNTMIIYGEITGYGKKGPWVHKPGQDLLAQSLSGITYLNGNKDQAPTPLGLSVADLFSGQHLVQGILAGLIRRESFKEGAYIHVSLLESIIDIQFEVFTTYLNDGMLAPQRSKINNANAYINAPYGIYQTYDGYIALAMIPIPLLGDLIGCPQLAQYTDEANWYIKRDEIKEIVANHLLTKTTKFWLDKLEPADIWCADVLTWDSLFKTEGFKSLDMIQNVTTAYGTKFYTTRCPITIDSNHFTSEKPAPLIGQDNKTYLGGLK
ncbi:MAG: CaiB/BaiF CoA-transferase family protein [Lachnospiraceae bacterium]|nr:CaiB/BaiF CoA-transferase family protein [Lachnospiraceae bacterium]